VINLNELEDLLALDHETRSFEIKGPGSTSDKAYVAKVARAVMAMGNLRDGGIVCLGIDDKRIRDLVPGLIPSQVVEWSDFDNVSTALARYCDPPVTFEVRAFKLTSNNTIVVLEVAEFDEVPHVCKREFPDVLKNGQTYVRPRGMPKSVPIPSSTEMRELHDLAIDKGVRQFIRRVGSAGLPLGSISRQEDIDRAAYDEERTLAWAKPSSQDIQVEHDEHGFFGAAGFTDIAIRPGPYDNARLRPDQLEPMLIEHVVRLRGWPVPMVDERLPLQRNGNWIAQDISAKVVPHEEAWRIFTSAQFLHRRVLATDLHDGAELEATHPDATGAVAVWDVLLYMVEVAEFGARWATALKCDSMTFDVALANIGGRQLISGDRHRDLNGKLTVATDQIRSAVSINTTQLLSDTRGVGVRLAQKLLQQFGATIQDQVLIDYQEEILR